MAGEQRSRLTIPSGQGPNIQYYPAKKPDSMKLLREFLSRDCLLHAMGGFAVGFGIPIVANWLYGPLRFWVVLVLLVPVTAFGFGREIQQAWDDRDGDRWPWQWSAHRWAEALAWLPGAVAGVLAWAVV